MKATIRPQQHFDRHWRIAISAITVAVVMWLVTTFYGYRAGSISLISGAGSLLIAGAFIGFGLFRYVLSEIQEIEILQFMEDRHTTLLDFNGLTANAFHQLAKSQRASFIKTIKLIDPSFDASNAPSLSPPPRERDELKEEIKSRMKNEKLITANIRNLKAKQTRLLYAEVLMVVFGTIQWGFVEYLSCEARIVGSIAC